MSILRAPFAFRWMVPFLLVASFLWGILWLLGFDLVMSPAWQVGLHYLALLFFFLASLGLVAPNGFRRMRGFDWAMALLLPAVLISVLLAGWFLADSYAGYRDPRLFLLAVVSVAAFGILYVFSFGLALFVRTIIDYVYPGLKRRRLVSPEPDSLGQGERPGEHGGEGHGG